MSDLIDREALKDTVKRYAGEPIKEKDRKCQAICLDMLGIIDAQPAAPRWVRCEERLPEKNGAYLVFMGYGDNWIWFKDIYMDGKFMADTCALNGAKVTHWMPIEPPNEDGERRDG